MIELKGGPLYRWEIGRTVSGFIGDVAQFYNSGDSVAMSVAIENPGEEVRIPDRYLATGKPVVVCDVETGTKDEETGVGDEETVLCVKVFPVKDRAKPKNYTPTQAEEAYGAVKKLSDEARAAAQDSEEAKRDAEDAAGRAWGYAENASVSAKEAEEAAEEAKAAVNSLEPLVIEMSLYESGESPVPAAEIYQAAQSGREVILTLSDDEDVRAYLSAAYPDRAIFTANGYNPHTKLAAPVFYIVSDGGIGAIYATDEDAVLALIASGGDGHIDMGDEGRIRTGSVAAPEIQVDSDHKEGFFLRAGEYEEVNAVAEFSDTVDDAHPVRLRNVAPGTEDLDAVNKTQLDAAVKEVDAVRSQVSSIESAFDVVKTVGNNILDPENSENAYRSTDSSMTVRQNDNRRQTIEPIPVDRSKSYYLYLCTTLTAVAEGANVQILWLDESGAYIGHYTTSATAIIGVCLKTSSIPTNCTQIYVQTSGAKPEYGGNTLDTLCVSQVPLDGFEAFGVTEQSRTLKPSALPEKVAPTNGKKMLIFGDSITETATMDDDGSNYTPNVKENWPVFATEMLQITDYRNYAKSGATIKTINGDAPIRSSLAGQLQLALGDELIPDIVVISMGINDAKDEGVNDTYETAMQKTELSGLDSTKFHEALRYAMWTLRITYPKSMMFIATPIQRNGAEPARTVRRGIIDMAERYNFKVIDAMYESGIIRENTDTFLKDDLHPNADGVAMMARLYSSNILSSYLGESYY